MGDGTRGYGQEIRRNTTVGHVRLGDTRLFEVAKHSRLKRLPVPALTNRHWRGPQSSILTDERGLTVQHVVRFAADGHVFAGSVRILRDGRVTVWWVSWPRASDRYNNTNYALGPRGNNILTAKDRAWFKRYGCKHSGYGE